MREPLLNVDDLPDARKQQLIFRVDHPEHPDQIRPVVLCSVTRFEPRVAIAVSLLTAIFETARGDIAPRTVQVATVVVGEMELHPAAVDDLVRGVKTERPPGRAGLGRILVIQPHTHRPDTRSRRS